MPAPSPSNEASSPPTPPTPVTPPRAPDTEMRHLDADQVERLAGAITTRYRTWALVACWGGLRWSEAVGLRRGCVDGPKVALLEQLVRRDGEWRREPPKTRAGRRTVTLPGSMADELAVHLAAGEGGADGLVWTNQRGAPMNGPSFTGNVFKPALRRAGIDPAVRIHDLRHTAVALAIAAGAHPKAIQARMGHATIGVTLDRYGHLFAEQDQAVAADLDQVRCGSTQPDSASSSLP